LSNLIALNRTCKWWTHSSHIYWK